MLGGVLVVGKNVIDLCLTEGRLGVVKSIRDVICYLILMAPLLLGDVDVETEHPEKSLSGWRLLVRVVVIAAEFLVCWHMLNS